MREKSLLLLGSCEEEGEVTTYVGEIRWQPLRKFGVSEEKKSIQNK